MRILFMKKLAEFGLLVVVAFGWLWAERSSAQERSSALYADTDVLEIERKLHDIMLPNVHFEDATLQEAVEFFRKESVELDAEKKGVQFVLRGDTGGIGGVIDLKLSEVPLVEALKYVVEISGTAYRVDGVAVVIGKDVENELMTRRFRVPANFAKMITETTPEKDPFAVPSVPTIKKFNAMNYFGRLGVTFPEGATMTYNRETSTLIVRNYSSNLEMVEAHLWELFDQEPRSIQVLLELYEVTEELGKDLMLRAKNGGGLGVVLEDGEGMFSGRKEADRLVAEGKAKLIGAPGLVTRSGQRAKAEIGRGIDFVSSYQVGKDGKDQAVWSKVLIGARMECDPVLREDKAKIEVNVAFEIGSGEPTIVRRKVVGPASGIERDVESVVIVSQKLTTAAIVYSGETQLIACVPGNVEGTVVLGFLTATASLP